MRTFNVTPSFGAPTITVLAADAKSALEISKTKAKEIAQGDNRNVTTGDTTVVKAIQANRGIEARYRRKLQEMIAEMHGSLEYWITAAYKDNPPKMATLVAEDAFGPAARIKKVLDDLAKRWVDRFNDKASGIAQAYLRSMFNASDNSFRQALKEAGWTVKFELTPTVRDALNASIIENTKLITNLPVEYLSKVQGIVMRTYAAGRDLHSMTKELKQLYPEFADRAETIALDQSNKANSTVNRARQLELGITEGIWQHSHGGKIPRADHLAANGKRYNIVQGCLISGEYIQPGQKINCRCSCRSVLPI